MSDQKQPESAAHYWASSGFTLAIVIVICVFLYKMVELIIGPNC